VLVTVDVSVLVGVCVGVTLGKLSNVNVIGEPETNGVDADDINWLILDTVNCK